MVRCGAWAYGDGMSRILFRVARQETWLELVYLLLGGVVAVVAFVVFVTGVSTGLSMLITLVGLPILLATAYADRGIAWIERRRAALVLGERIEQAYRRPERSGILSRAKTVAVDPQTWKDAGWMVVLSVVGFACWVATVVLWSIPLWALTLPVYWWILPEDSIDLWPGEHADAWWEVGVLAALGLVLLVPVPWICAALAHGQARLARLLLSPGTSERRIGELTRTRAAAVDAQAMELRRIERDLHDGAQARMVAVTMDLGLAREKLDSDPEAARSLVESAHAEATTAIAELRELVAGIAPAVLSDRGLDAALSSLVASCRVPVSVDVRLPDRVPPSVEVAAYFVVSESLANVQKHAGATRASVDVRSQDGRLVVEVGDDGSGGADPTRGSGLAGLRDRVAALDGTVTVVSPPGGPTLVRAEIPCAS
jgi:signal transduction histidine kinase